MKRILGKFVITLPVATFLYSMLILFTALNLDVRWLFLAVALDVADWIVTEAL